MLEETISVTIPFPFGVVVVVVVVAISGLVKGRWAVAQSG